jgi:Ca2+:H+ antiporter
MLYLLIFVPVAIAVEHLAPGQHLLIFAASALAILPLAGWMGRATEQLAERTGEGVGGLLNATFGNAAELIIALSALRAGLYTLVKASIVGSIVGNTLLVLGAAMLAGGIHRTEQRFNADAARSQATLLVLAAISLIVPSAYRLGDPAAVSALASLSIWIAVALLAVYALYLVFSLGTHASLFKGSDTHVKEPHEASWSTRSAVLILGAATVMIA